jgi:hypothetical protein
MKMKKLISFLLICLVGLGNGFAQDFDYSRDFPRLFQESKAENSPSFYPSLKARFLKEGEHFSKVELLALLVGQTAQKTYNAYGMVGLERTFLGAEQFPADTVLKYGKLVQDLNPVSLSLNFGLWKAYEKANNPEFATVYKKRFDLICETILASGNGSPARPYLVISPVDGSVLISKYWQETLTQMGSGENEAGYFLDILTYKKGNEEKTLHFVIDHGMGGLSKMMQQIVQSQSK